MNKSSFSTPVLFLIFNRPETTKMVFKKIRELQPAYLFVSADGPRKGKKEDNKCKEARDIIKDIDWECKVSTNYSETNLGCKIAVSSGISWFFRNVDEGIILEDDCLPDLSFFYFCNELLERYRNDERIMHIGGSNFQDGIQRGKASYYFSRLVHVWGWATWKRAWNKYEVSMPSFNSFKQQELIKEIFPDIKHQKYWLKTFEEVYSGGKDTWDFQWGYTVMLNNAVSAIPNQNLVSNLGFGTEATHTHLSGSPLSKRNTTNIQSIVHPDHFIPDRTADEYTFKKYLSPGKFNKLRQVIATKLKT